MAFTTVLSACGSADNSGPAIQPATNEPPAPTVTATGEAAGILTDKDETVEPETHEPQYANTPRGQIEEELVNTAREEGSVSVIVTLQIPYTPEPLLNNQAEIDEQRAAIAAAQDALLADLKGFNVTNVSRLTLFPQIVLTVDEAALEQLGRSPLVEQVQENSPDPPTG